MLDAIDYKSPAGGGKRSPAIQSQVIPFERRCQTALAKPADFTDASALPASGGRSPCAHQFRYTSVSFLV
jgi:hypothetical protein